MELSNYCDIFDGLNWLPSSELALALVTHLVKGQHRQLFILKILNWFCP